MTLVLIQRCKPCSLNCWIGSLLQAGIRLPSRSTGWLNGLAAGEQAEAFTLQRDGTCRRQSMPVRDRIFVERAALVHHLQLEAERLHGPRCGTGVVSVADQTSCGKVLTETVRCVSKPPKIRYGYLQGVSSSFSPPLANALKAVNGLYRVQFRHNCELLHLDTQKRVATYACHDSKPPGSKASDSSQPVAEEAVGYDILVGTDGRNSRVRSLLQAQDPALKCSSTMTEYTYQSFSQLPPTGDSTRLLEACLQGPLPHQLAARSEAGCLAQQKWVLSHKL